jgi:hypothetical protein
MSNKDKIVRIFIISIFVSLYILTSTVSTIHVIDFFELGNPRWLAITLAIAFEIGAAASLASLVILKKMNKTLVWSLFIAITLMQIQGNMFFSYKNLHDFQQWSELFNLMEEEPIFQKRILSLVSGAILPLIALGFIKSLVDYIKPENKKDEISQNEIDGDLKELKESKTGKIIKELSLDKDDIEDNNEPFLEKKIDIKPIDSFENDNVQKVNSPSEDTYNNEIKLPFGENMKNILSHDYNPPGILNANSNKDLPKTHDSKNNPN